MMLNIMLQVEQPLFKNKNRTGSGSGSATGSAEFFLEVEAPEAKLPEAEVLRVGVEVEALKISALLHHWL
jgi:hypothetical protein